jgi:hypothetical protein
VPTGTGAPPSCLWTVDAQPASNNTRLNDQIDRLWYMTSPKGFC